MIPESRRSMLVARATLESRVVLQEKDWMVHAG